MGVAVTIDNEASKQLSRITAKFGVEDAHAFKHILGWRTKAREKQVAPEGEWSIWLILAGRGWGKTRTGAEDILSYAMRYRNVRCGVIAPTRQDLRRVCFEGPSGIVSSMPEECYLDSDPNSYNRSSMEIKLWNGSIIQGYAAIEPNRLRGPQFHRIWADELAAWRYTEAYDQMLFGLRLGESPQLVITTTPRPTDIIRDLIKRSGSDVYVTTGTTFENYDNLADSALKQLEERYAGTRLGRQELYAEVLDDTEGALWSYSMIEHSRITQEDMPELRRIVVAVDPAVTNNEKSDETGIVVAGVDSADRYYVIEDVSDRMGADTWARTAVDCYFKHNADRIVAEVNNGGDLVEGVIRTIDSTVPYTAVRASRGKIVRAEPIAALYEQKRVHHVGLFKELEDQMCSYTGLQSSKSPDRLDALVWALTELSSNTGQAFWRIS
jgi:predicted phage terminase large subunit-like protein